MAESHDPNHDPAVCPAPDVELVAPVVVGSLWRRKPPGREVLRIERVWDFQGGPTFRGHPTTGGRPLIGPLDYLRENYTEEPTDG